MRPGSEARECDLLIHVVDASDAAFPSQIEVTREVPHGIADEIPALLVLDMSDRLTKEKCERLSAACP